MINYYVEVQGQDKRGSISFYGFKNEVLILSNGYRKDYKTKGLQETVTLVDRLVKNLVGQGCTIINKETNKEIR